MKFSYNWLKELVPKLPKPEKLAELLTMRAFEVECVEPYGTDTALDIAVLPNRMGDASGHIGMAREISASRGISFSEPRAVYKEHKKQKTKDVLSVIVKDKKACPRYIGRVIDNVKVKESPRWLRERLEVCGLRSINNIVDITNYIMLLTGQPLHAFDFNKLTPVNGAGVSGSGKKTIVVRSAADGEHITTLDDVEFLLQSGMLVVADGDSPLAIAGIKGGKKAEITNATTRIVLEAANFNGPSVRTTSRALGVRTDSSLRFSVGLSASLAENALRHACALMQNIAGGEVWAGAVDINAAKEKPAVVFLRASRVNSVLGAYIKEKEMWQILRRLGCAVAGNGNVLRVTPPVWRKDITLEEDLIEEIGRIYGFENIEAKHSLSELVPPEENSAFLMQERMRDMLMGAGFQEALNYSFVSAEDIAALGNAPEEYMELENPSREEYRYMRASLGAGLLKNAAENSKRQHDIRLFEIGSVFSRAGEIHHEGMHAAGIIAGKTAGENNPLFFELKGALALFFEHMGVDAWFDAEPSPGGTVLHPHRAALIKIGEERVGVMGEVHPQLLKKYGINASVALFELDADALSRLTLKEKEYRPVSRYPSVMRDIALLVPVNTRVVEVLDVIENTGGELLVDTDLIDMYAGPELPDSKKNFAFRLVFQAQDRTLTDQEVTAIVSRITKTLEETNLEWEVRK